MGSSNAVLLAGALALLTALGGCDSHEAQFSPWTYTADGSVITGMNCSAGYADFQRHARSLAKGEAGFAAEVWQPSVPVSLSRGDPRWGPVTVYPVDGELSLYVLTRPGHPAHPAVIMKHLAPHSEGVAIAVDGCGYGDKAAFARLLEASKRLQDLYGLEVQYITPPPEPPPA